MTLRDQHHVPAIAAIGDDAADQREQQDRHFAGEAVEAEVERRRRTAHRDDQPRLRDLLHPRADARSQRAEPQQPEIAVGEGDCDPRCSRIDSIAQRDSILCDIAPHEESRSDPPPLHGDLRRHRPRRDPGARRPLGARAGQRRAEDHPRDGQRGAENFRRRRGRGRKGRPGRGGESQPVRLRRPQEAAYSARRLPAVSFQPGHAGHDREQGEAAVPVERGAVGEASGAISRTRRSGRCVISRSWCARAR